MSVWIEVVKSPESQQCPDASTILNSAHALFPHKELIFASLPERAALNVQVTISRNERGYEGVLWARGAHEGQRRIVDPDEGCQGLAHALAVALVLLIEPSSEPPVNRSAGTPQPAWPVAPSSTPDRRVAQVSIEAGALAAVGLLGGAPGSSSSFGAFVGLAYSHRFGPGIRLRAMGLQSLPTPYGAGKVRIDLLAASPALCWRLGGRHAWTLDPCWDLSVGRQRGVASNLVPYLGTNTQSRLWLTTGPSLTFSHILIGVLHATVTAAMGVRLNEQPFSVIDMDRTLPVQTQAPMGEYLGLGLAAFWPSAIELTGR